MAQNAADHHRPSAITHAATALSARRLPVLWRGALLLALTLPIVLAACAPTGKTTTRQTTVTPTSVPVTPSQLDFPAVDPTYIYLQLAYMAATYQHRQAGYTANASGHDGFANYWAQAMQRNLAGFGPTVRRDPFTVAGWLGNPAD